ncbi:MAG: ribosome maturation factor RimM [Chloroflexota bacterium]
MTTQKPDSPRYLVLGRITRPHGVRGELRVQIFTDYPERVNDLDAVFLGKDVDDRRIKRYEVVKMRMHKNAGLLTVAGVKSRDEADRMRNLYVMVAIEDAVGLEDDEFYLYQLIGMAVKTGDGVELGIIERVLQTGANDVYVVKSPDYGEILLPATEETIIDHDIDNGVVLVNLLDGLLPEK